MSALEKIEDLKRQIGEMTGEDVEVINDWTRTVKRYGAYRTLKSNIAFRDFLEKMESQLRVAVEKINDEETSEAERKKYFWMRDDRLFILSLFTEAEAILASVEQAVSGKIDEFSRFQGKNVIP